MANSPQATKRARQIAKLTLHNHSQKAAMRTLIKKVEKLSQGSDQSGLVAAFRNAIRAIDKLAGRAVIHPNTGARLKKRLNKRVQKATSSS